MALAEALGCTGDDDLAGSVDVGDPARVGRAGDGGGGLLVGGAKQRRHDAGPVVGGVLGDRGALGCDLHADLEAERAGSDQGGHLTERVAGEGRDVGADLVLLRFPAHQGVQQHGHLRGLGGLELVTEEQRRERGGENFLGVFDEVPRRKVAQLKAHSCCLTALTWENNRNAHANQPPLDARTELFDSVTDVMVTQIGRTL